MYIDGICNIFCICAEQRKNARIPGITRGPASQTSYPPPSDPHFFAELNGTAPRHAKGPSNKGDISYNSDEPEDGRLSPSRWRWQKSMFVRRPRGCGADLALAASCRPDRQAGTARRLCPRAAPARPHARTNERPDERRRLSGRLHARSPRLCRRVRFIISGADLRVGVHEMCSILWPAEHDRRYEVSPLPALDCLFSTWDGSLRWGDRRGHPMEGSACVYL